jgi:hypothetical protein
MGVVEYVAVVVLWSSGLGVFMWALSLDGRCSRVVSGRPAELRCGECGAVVGGGWRFCERCGADVGSAAGKGN